MLSAVYCSLKRERNIVSFLLFLQQDVRIDELETNIIVLVHGGGFGAWCWYKSISLLEDSGFKVNAIDLTGSGVHSSDTNKITSLSEYVKPLTTFLKSLPDEQKVCTCTFILLPRLECFLVPKLDRFILTRFGKWYTNNE
jgi:alpha-beta hydrolase superfamily lysophospholipase